MNKLIGIALSLLLVFGIIVWTKGATMREIRTEIDIVAPPSKVWSILADFNHWKEWNPIVNQMSGLASLGAELSVTMRCEDGTDGANYTPVITAFEEPRLLRWHGTMLLEFLFANDKVIELHATGSGTRLIHREQFSGMLVPVLWGKLHASVPIILHSMNEALKNTAEKS